MQDLILMHSGTPVEGETYQKGAIPILYLAIAGNTEDNTWQYQRQYMAIPKIILIPLKKPKNT